jgi:hypothetical protein
VYKGNYGTDLLQHHGLIEEAFYVD